MIHSVGGLHLLTLAKAAYNQCYFRLFEAFGNVFHPCHMPTFLETFSISADDKLSRCEAYESLAGNNCCCVKRWNYWVTLYIIVLFIYIIHISFALLQRDMNMAAIK